MNYEVESAVNGAMDKLQGVRDKARSLFDKDTAIAFFKLADIEVIRAHELTNKYWPLHPCYDDIRSPWWLVETSLGNIVIGLRKRVISIDWESTGIRKIVTEDDVTKSKTMVHAWSRDAAVRYLRALRPTPAEQIDE